MTIAIIAIITFGSFTLLAWFLMLRWAIQNGRLAIAELLTKTTSIARSATFWGRN